MSDAPFEKPGLNLLGDKEVAQGLIAESNRRLFQARTLAGIAGVPLFGNRREMPDGSVITTAVFGGQSRVNITGAPPPEKKPIEPEEDLPSGYLLWPTSDQNPDGVLIRDDVPVSPTVLLTMEGTSADVELDMPIQAARDDWLSDDGDGEYGENLLTYQTDSKFRYQFAGYDNSGRGQPVIFVNGIGAYTQHGVRGACMRGDDTVIYASISGDWKTLTLHHFAPLEEAGTPDETTFGTYTSALTFTQPVFFDGKGAKFVTVAREAMPDVNGQLIYHRVRGAIAVVDDELVLTVTTVPLGMAPYVKNLSTVHTGSLTNWTEVTHNEILYETLIGLDMTIDGTETLAVFRHESRFDSNTVVTSTPSGVVGVNYSVTTDQSIDSTKNDKTMLKIDGSIVREVEYSEVRNYTYHVVVVAIGLEYTGTDRDVITTVEGEFSISLKDIDLRFGAYAAVIGNKRSQDFGVEKEWNPHINGNIPFITNQWNIAGPLKYSLEFVFENFSESKNIMTYVPPGVPARIPSLVHRPYRLFASRRKGDLVANVGVMSELKGSATYPDELAAWCDMTPITVVRNKRADFTLSNEDLGLGDSDTGVTFYSVRMT